MFDIEDVKKDIIQRLNILIGDKSQKEFAMDLGLKRDLVAAMVNGRSMPTLDTITRIVNYFHISPNWLILGIGNKYLDEKKFYNSESELLIANEHDINKEKIEVNYQKKVLDKLTKIVELLENK